MDEMNSGEIVAATGIAKAMVPVRSGERSREVENHLHGCPGCASEINETEKAIERSAIHPLLFLPPADFAETDYNHR
jgi:hypothetical protein